MVVSLVVAGRHLANMRFRGVEPAAAVKGVLAAITGALTASTGGLLCLAFVSAGIGLIEVDGYVRSSRCVPTLAIGITGISILFLSFIGLKRTLNKADAGDES